MNDDAIFVRGRSKITPHSRGRGRGLKVCDTIYIFFISLKFFVVGMIEEGSALLFSTHSNIKCVCGRFISISIILYCNKLLAPNKMCECVSFYVYLCLYSSIFIYLYSSHSFYLFIFFSFHFHFFSFLHIQFQMWLCRSDVMDGLLVLWLSLVTVVSLA